MRKLLFVISILTAGSCIAQNEGIYGTYFRSYKDDFVNGCCQLSVMLKLKANNTFSIYGNNDQGDYKEENMSTGKFCVRHDSVFFLSEIGMTNKISRLLYNDNLSSNTIRVTFVSKEMSMEPVIFNQYYSVDDSLHVSPLRIISTIPMVDLLVNKTNTDEILLDRSSYKLKQFQVLIEKPKDQILYIKGNSSVFDFNLNIVENFSKYNDFVIKIDEPFGTIRSMGFFDYSGYRFKVNQNYLSEIESSATKKRSWPQGEKKYFKINFNELDSIRMNFFIVDTTTISAKNFLITKDRLIRYTKDSSNTDMSKKFNDNRYFRLTADRYDRLISKFANIELFEIPWNRIWASQHVSFDLMMYSKQRQFKITSDIPSLELYKFLFTEIVP